jgi:hypothetical protein
MLLYGHRENRHSGSNGQFCGGQLCRGGDRSIWRGGACTTWANKSGDVFVIFFALECRASRIETDGFGDSLARRPRGEDRDREQDRARVDIGVGFAVVGGWGLAPTPAFVVGWGPPHCSTSLEAMESKLVG